MAEPQTGAGFLTQIVERVRRELAANPLPTGVLAASARRQAPARDLSGALRRPGIGVIAEVKRASPSAGPIPDGTAAWDPGDRAARYERGGAAAVSVLTEPEHFGGSVQDLIAVRAVTVLPVLRKDCVVHPSQVVEARAAGADAVLLITAALSDAELRSLLDEVVAFGMTALVEANSERDLDRAMGAGATLIGVNARDLETLEVDVDRALSLLGRTPGGTVKVLESGVRSRDDVRRAEDAGADAVLVGEALMRASDPEAKLRELLGS